MLHNIAPVCSAPIVIKFLRINKKIVTSLVSKKPLIPRVSMNALHSTNIFLLFMLPRSYQ